MSKLRRSLKFGSSIALVAMAIFALAVSGPARVSQASSHREAPMISKDPVADATDLYAFVSPDRTIR